MTTVDVLRAAAAQFSTTTDVARNLEACLRAIDAAAACGLLLELAEHSSFEEVSYLRDPHRHMFHFKCHKIVNHSDRDCEFIMLKSAVDSWLFEKYWDHDKKALFFGSMSCEMIAKELIAAFDLCQCEVSEDGENGAILRVLKTSSETGGGMAGD